MYWTVNKPTINTKWKGKSMHETDYILCCSVRWPWYHTRPWQAYLLMQLCMLTKGWSPKTELSGPTVGHFKVLSLMYEFHASRLKKTWCFSVAFSDTTTSRPHSTAVWQMLHLIFFFFKLEIVSRAHWPDQHLRFYCDYYELQSSSIHKTRYLQGSYNKVMLLMMNLLVSLVTYNICIWRQHCYLALLFLELSAHFSVARWEM